MTKAQYRMVKRIIEGAKLPVSNYRPEHATIAACVRHLWIADVRDVWVVTAQGRLAIQREAS